ncbi:hypothetical protein MM236_01080 [Belliella sp. DSM 107340]|uniref:Uncharacterized protein n=1 Tax=Belliella calami TaxID=2923436 RepID=A0ABS9UIW0_9BACT|nr:hypothetical protein [Belliella calami]MCH7396554.1 hypothetical protein [Belliella calami]
MSWVNDILKFLKERVSNPFFTTFLFFWIIWNWKGIAYFIYSKDDIKDTLNYIVLNYKDWNYNLIYPIVFTIVSILISDIIYFALEYSTNYFSLKRIKKNSDKLKEEYTFRKDYAVEQAQFELALKGVKTIDELKEQVEFHQEEIKTLNSTILNLNANVNEKSTEIKEITNREVDLIEKLKLKNEEFNNLEAQSESFKREIINFIKFYVNRFYIKEMPSEMKFTWEEITSLKSINFFKDNKIDELIEKAFTPSNASSFEIEIINLVNSIKNYYGENLPNHVIALLIIDTYLKKNLESK